MIHQYYIVYIVVYGVRIITHGVRIRTWVTNTETLFIELKD